MTRPATRAFSSLSLTTDKPAKDPSKERMLLFLSLASPRITAGDVVNTEHSIVSLHDEHILEITNKQIKIDADKIVADVKKREIPRFRHDPPGQSVSTAVQELIKLTDALSGTSPDTFNPLKDFKIFDLDLLDKLNKMSSVRGKIESLDCVHAPDFKDQFQKVFEVMSVKEELERCEYLMSEASLALLPEYHCRIDVLKDLKYIDSGSTVQLKGRVACEMGSHELMVTELMFENQLTDRPPEEIAALLSCMVFQQRNCSEAELTPTLKKGVEDIKKCAEKVGAVQVACGLLQPVGDFVEQFNFGLVEVVYEWARGMPFSDITQLTDVQEGVIVRTIQRLDETLRDVKDAARVIGDPVLYQKMDQASAIIKRDIVFAASLYTQ